TVFHSRKRPSIRVECQRRLFCRFVSGPTGQPSAFPHGPCRRRFCVASQKGGKEPDHVGSREAKLDPTGGRRARPERSKENRGRLSRTAQRVRLHLRLFALCG